MTDISKHAFLRQIHALIQAIEACGASPELTRAVSLASALYKPATELIDASTPLLGSSVSQIGAESDATLLDVATTPAKGLTLADIAATITSEFYFTAGDGVRGESKGGTSPAGRADSLNRLTICVLVLRNGTQVIGRNYGSIDPRMHDPAMGRREARKHAFEQVWELEGYLLRQRLSAGGA